MKPESFSQLMIVILVVGVLTLTILDKPVPQPVLLVLGVFCPSPLQLSKAVFGTPGGISTTKA